jgi:competence protein ComEC
VPRLIALGWYRGRHEDAALTQPRSELRAGQRWRFAVRLRQPHGNANPHGYDYELTPFEQGVRATGYVRDSEPPLRLNDASGHPVERWRQQVLDAIFAQVSDPGSAGMLAALAVGDQAAIECDDWELLRSTGVAHLMSISGLHVTMFAWLAGLVVVAAWRRSERAMLWLPAQQAARWGGIAAALAYAVFSGWGVPSQRTVWVLATVALLQSLGRRWPWPLVPLAAAVVVTLGDPWALLQPGFCCRSWQSAC